MTSPAADEILVAAEHLPSGATLVIPQVEWDDYERLVEDLGDQPGVRVSYYRGRLEIMSPLVRHDSQGRFIDQLVRKYAEKRGLTVEMAGSATWKRRSRAVGLEANCCYFIENAQHAIGRLDMNLDIDPPPDLAVEIDQTRSSIKKLVLYGALEVPEVWRFDGKAIHMHEWTGKTYIARETSRVLDGLSAELLTEFIGVAKAEGQTKALDRFAKRLRKSRRR